MAHLKPILTRSFWVLIFGTVAATAFGLFWQLGSGLPPPAILSVIPLGIVGYDAGREYARREGQRPSFANGVKLSAILLAMSVLLYIFIFVGAVIGQGGAVSGLFFGLSRLMVPILLVSALYFAMIFVMMWFGARSVR